jgi:flagellar hook-associated protein 2
LFIKGQQCIFDPSTDSLNTVLSDTNSCAAGVTGTFDSGNIVVTFENSTASDTSIINFEADDDDSNFLDVIAVTTATQSTGVSGSTEVSSSHSLGVIDSLVVLDTVSFANGAITSGSFSINGVSISVDPTTDTLGDIISAINSSGAQVNASFDGTTDTIRVLSTNLGSRTVNFGGASDTSNFLSITNLDTATQTAGNDLEFTVNGGTTQTRNSNEISDAVTGVTLRLLSTGTSTVTVNSDNDSIVETVQEFIDEFNNSVGAIRDLIGTDGALRGDSGIRSIENFMRANIFSQVADLGGDFSSFLDIGISTGQDFDSSTPSVLELDEDAFREALRDDRSNVEDLFSNTDGTGIADILFDFVDEITRTTGFLNARSKAGGSIDTQIRSLNDQIDRIEDRLLQKEERLRRQFTRLEQISAGFQNQSAALAGFSFGGF